MSSADSRGLSTLKADAVLIFDLDGTILSVNSFPYWALYMMAGSFRGLGMAQRLALSARSSQALIKRKMLGQSHSRTKFLLQELWAAALEKDAGHTALHNLTGILMRYVRPNLRALLEMVATGQADAILATSAAGEYAQALGKSLGFTHILTTPLCMESDSLENCRERKRDRVLTLLADKGWDRRPRLFFTDHEEDLPLIQECHRTLWFGRQGEVDELKAHAPHTRIIPCRHLSEKEIMRLVAANSFAPVLEIEEMTVFNRYG